jgi:hypothetical protein
MTGRLLWLPALVTRRTWRQRVRSEAKVQQKLAKASLWNRRHQQRCVRLKEQIRLDQEYIDRLEAELPQETVKRLHEEMRPIRAGGKPSA